MKYGNKKGWNESGYDVTLLIFISVFFKTPLQMYIQLLFDIE